MSVTIGLEIAAREEFLYVDLPVLSSMPIIVFLLINQADFVKF